MPQTAAHDYLSASHPIPLEPSGSYYRARYYDPNVGKFLSEDPLGFGGSGPNLYAYAHNSPVDLFDPMGMYTGWELVQDFGSFSEAFADTLTFGSASRLNDALGAGSAVKRCGWVHKAGTGAGIAFGIVVGGSLGAQAAEANAGEEGFEFSHWIPKRSGGPRSTWNGNFVSEKFHYLTDNSRYPSPAGSLQRWGPKLARPLQQVLRIPWVYDGAAAGAAYTVVGANSGKVCECQ